MTGMADGIYKISEWAMRLAYLNILFVLFSLLGIVAFGVGPAFMAMLVVVKKWMSQEEFPIFKTYLNEWKGSFIKGNLLGLLFITVGTILIVNYYILPQFNEHLRVVFTAGMLLLTLLYLMTVMYIFPLAVQFRQLSVKRCFKYGFVLGVTHPIFFLAWIVGVFIMYQLYRVFPGLLPFYAFSALAIWQFFVTRYVLLKVKIT
ncbi:DUF624 domain-containing protein [Anaerobacillus alkaliphilus]|uniref:DUF624 domain-containing protein n=1 Tax=Anaerobacillus alkaliphilus TaxID=1548597 RepID=A0A4Q0VUU9_9BACI|nr:DUF624 domain-containing protein [Anaerobacillus alkaliphilus]RXJ02194.1 DUF624 domain-containing protein [Anaerobacillus alkaliphilus]